jgi:hypothetical protein
VTRTKWIVLCIVLAGVMALAVATAQAGPLIGPTAPQAPLGAGFTYQGRLQRDGSVVSDTCDLVFSLWDAEILGVQSGVTQTVSDVEVTDGYFTVELNDGGQFGGDAFAGEGRWLQVAVQCSGDSGYAALGRQKLTAAPYALYALRAPWVGLSGVPAGFADGVDDVAAVVSGTNVYAGDGLTQVSASDGVTLSVALSYRLPQDCADGEIAEWDESKGRWYCGANGQGGSYQDVVVVAKGGGDYASVQAAVDSIADADADHAYLVWIAPGVYSETVTMKPHVHFQGAGRELTVISSTIGNSPPFLTQATLVLTHHVSLRDLAVNNSGADYFQAALLAGDGVTQTLVTGVTVRAQGSGTVNYAIYLDGSGIGVTLQDVAALAENGSNNSGLCNGGALTLRGGSFTARGGTSATGVSSSGNATLEAEDVTVLAEGSDDSNTALSSNGGTVALYGGSFTARRGGQTRGIFIASVDTALEAENITVLAENGSGNNYGLYNTSATVVLRGGSFTGRGGSDAWGIYNTQSGAALETQGAMALAENGSSYNYSLQNASGAVATLRGGFFTAVGGGQARGIQNEGGSSLTVQNADVAAQNASANNYGMVNISSAVATLRSSALTAVGTGSHGLANGDSSTLTADACQLVGSTALYMNGGAVSLGVSQVAGTVNRASGTLVCFQVYDGSYASVSCP